MAITKQALLTDLDYSAWANQRLLDACSALTAEEMDRDLGASHSGVIRTLRHIYYAERVWMKRLRANSLPPLHEVGDQHLFGDAPPEPGLGSSEEIVARSLGQYAGMVRASPGSGTGQRTFLSSSQWRRAPPGAMENPVAHGESFHAASRPDHRDAAPSRPTAAQHGSLFVLHAGRTTPLESTHTERGNLTSHASLTPLPPTPKIPV